jgi:hypothetical protein
VSYKIFMLCHSGGTIILDMNNSITHNNKSNILLNANICMSLMDIKQVICHGLRWNYINVKVDIA